MNRTITIFVNGSEIKGSEDDLRQLLGIKLSTSFNFYQSKIKNESKSSTQTKIIPINMMPKHKAIEEFIRNQPNFTHSLPLISMKFLGRKIDAKSEKSLYNSLWTKTKRARMRILKDAKRNRPLAPLKWEKERESLREPSTYSLSVSS
jgi:hypothetical protein